MVLMETIYLTWLKTTRADLTEYGIKIPLLPSRSEQIRSYLHANMSFKFHAPLSTGSIEPVPFSADDLLLAHDRSYVDRIMTHGARVIEECYELFDAQGRPRRYEPAPDHRPLTDLVAAHLREASGTYESLKCALQSQFTFFLGGGMHHASASHPRGFCMVNDVVIALRKALKLNKIRSAWVIDTDAHKGDGTASLCQDDPAVKTLSIHMADGWPLDEGKTLADGTPNPAFAPSDIDIPIATGGEDIYLHELETGLRRMQSEMPRPDIAVVVAGSDPFEGDVLPSASLLKLSLNQMLDRDVLVYESLRAQNIPQLWVLAGGYGPAVFRCSAQFLQWVLPQITPPVAVNSDT
jgi:acetoin utilization deacetylase AcuC-like enzyme